MKFVYLDSFKKDYKKLPLEIKKQFNKKLILLKQNPCHPSLKIKELKSQKGIWTGRISINYRFTFQKGKDFYLFRRIGPHNTLKNP